MISKSGVMTRLDVDFHDFLLEVQEQRQEIKTDKDKTSITKLSRLCWKLLRNKKNLDLLLTRRL